MKREDVKQIILSYLTDYYGNEDVEITIEEENTMFNLLRSIADKKAYEPSFKSPMSEDTKKKISNSCKGKKRSEESKERIRQNSRRINVYQYDKNTGELVAVWSSTHEVAEVNQYNQSLISKACRGKKPSAYGYVWSYHPLGSEDIKLHVTIKKTIKKNEQSFNNPSSYNIIHDSIPTN